MKPTVMIGAQWGDEGKGKLVDALAADYDVVARFNGGNNAGHTIMYQGEQCKLHVLPSGIFQKKNLLIAQGAVFDPNVMLAELEFCKKHRLKLDLLIDYRVNLVMPYHKLFDGAHEKWKGGKATGSVKVGVGYCYEDRNNRSGIRCEDLLHPKILEEKIVMLLPLKMAILERVYGIKANLKVKTIVADLLASAKIIGPYIGDVSMYVANNLDKKKILFEGAMGTMLDGQFGTYPYTVANNTIASSVFTSVGMPEVPLNALGVVKAYTTRVGGGPFPTEQINANGEKLQTIGREIAATSGRIRRCGWLDLPIIRFAHRLNRFTSLALTKLDVLSGFSKISVCVGYRYGKKLYREYPGNSHEYAGCKPIYKVFEGWNTSLGGIRSWTALPKYARAYIRFIENDIGVPVKFLSLGAERDALIRL
ncbi:MAG: adenylosuccinate synthase [Patescibacteria group bacterium]